MVVDPDRESRWGRVLKIVGIVATLAGAGLLLGGVIGIAATAAGATPSRSSGCRSSAPSSWPPASSCG